MRFSSRCAAFVRTCSYSSTVSPCCCSALTGLPLLGRVRRGRTFLVDINLRYLVICTFGFGLTVLFPGDNVMTEFVRCFRSFIHSSIHPSVHPSVRLSVRPSVRPSVCPSVRPSVRPSVHPSIHSFIHSFILIHSLANSLTHSFTRALTSSFINACIFYLSRSTIITHRHPYIKMHKHA